MSTILSSFVAGVLGFTVVVATVALSYHFVFSGWPFPSTVDDMVANIRSIGGGFAGLPLPFNPLALLILAHAGYILVRTLWFLLRPRSEGPDVVSAAVALMLLVFFPYYVNRPATFSLWTFAGLYALLLAPLIASDSRRLVSLFVAAFVVLPPSLGYLASPDFAPMLPRRVLLGWQRGCADGLIVPTDVCQSLRKRAAALKRLATAGLVVWSTGVPMLTMRMTGLYGSFAANDLFYMTRTEADFSALVMGIERLNPRFIAVDDPDNDVIPPAPMLQDFNRRLIEALGPRYCTAGVSDGWQVWELCERTEHRLVR